MSSKSYHASVQSLNTPNGIVNLPMGTFLHSTTVVDPSACVATKSKRELPMVTSRATAVTGPTANPPSMMASASFSAVCGCVPTRCSLPSASRCSTWCTTNLDLAVAEVERDTSTDAPADTRLPHPRLGVCAKCVSSPPLLSESAAAAAAALPLPVPTARFLPLPPPSAAPALASPASFSSTTLMSAR